MDRLFNSIRTVSPWFIPFAAAAIVHMLALIIGYSTRIDAMLALLPPSANEADRAAAEQLLISWQPVRTLFLPLRLLVGWSVFAVLLYYAAASFRPPNPLRLRQVFSFVLIAEILPAFGALLNAIFPTGLGQFPLPPAPLSLQMFFTSQSWIVNTLLGNANLFQLGYIIFLAAGLSFLSGFGKAKTLAIVVMLWVLGVFSQISLMQVSARGVNLF